MSSETWLGEMIDLLTMKIIVHFDLLTSHLFHWLFTIKCVDCFGIIIVLVYACTHVLYKITFCPGYEHC